MPIRDVILMFAVLPSAGLCQSTLDRADPAVIERDLQKSPIDGARADKLPSPVTGPAEPAAAAIGEVTPGAIVVTSDTLSNQLFVPVIADYVGRPLRAEDLKAMLQRISGVARQRGYVFATASIPPQSLTGGTLRVVLDEGRIDAVRTLGTSNAQADAVLAKLVTGRPVTQRELERALLLASDIAGVRVVETRYVREQGFGILLVTLAADRFGFSAQLDNRGTDVIGPVRATALAQARNLFGGGDELGVLVAATPFDPGELWFGQIRYAAPVGAGGDMLTSSLAFGRTRPGASLKPFDVEGNSVSTETEFSHPLLRSRRASLWATFGLRGLWLDQDILGITTRRDRVVTASAGLSSAFKLAGGVARGSGNLVVGLPFDGVTRRGDPLASRSDGDARFGRFESNVEWVSGIAPRTSVRLAASAQLATRPLLASEEFGLGGAAFGRAYDYYEVSGENGAAGAMELRYDLPASGRGLVRRAQLYAFADAGYVGNLSNGVGGGDLYSMGAGARLGLGKSFDVELELAQPVGRARSSSGDRSPRLSFRLNTRW